MSEPWDAGLRAAEGEWVIRLAASPHPDEVPSEVWVFPLNGITVMPGALAQYFIDDVVAKNANPDGYVIQERTSTFEWGASSATWELVITAVATLVGKDAYDLLKARAISATAGRRQLPPLARDDALASARLAIARRFPDVIAGNLLLTSEEQADGGLVWTFWLRTDDAEFEWQTDQRTGVPVTRIRRIQRNA